jgi:hypothetical protein
MANQLQTTCENLRSFVAAGRAGRGRRPASPAFVGCISGLGGGRGSLDHQPTLRLGHPAAAVIRESFSVDSPGSEAVHFPRLAKQAAGSAILWASSLVVGHAHSSNLLVLLTPPSPPGEPDDYRGGRGSGREGESRAQLIPQVQ